MQEWRKTKKSEQVDSNIDISTVVDFTILFFFKQKCKKEIKKILVD